MTRLLSATAKPQEVKGGKQISKPLGRNETLKNLVPKSATSGVAGKKTSQLKYAALSYENKKANDIGNFKRYLTAAQRE